MDDETSACPDCSSEYVEADNYCRNCGMYVAALRSMPLVRSETAPPVKMQRERAGLPAPMRKVATALAIGTALQIGVGIAGKYVASQTARQATRAAVNAATTRPARSAKRHAEPVQVVPTDPRDDATAMSETVMIRRVWIRRG